MRFFIFDNARLSRIASLVISASGKHLDEAQCFSYLVVNNNLTLEDHFDNMRHKMNKKLVLVRRIKSCLPLSARITFWGDRGNTTLMPELQVLHNKATGLILDLPHRASASDALVMPH